MPQSIPVHQMCEEAQETLREYARLATERLGPDVAKELMARAKMNLEIKSKTLQ